jgi:hypothetical protein
VSPECITRIRDCLAPIGRAAREPEIEHMLCRYARPHADHLKAAFSPPTVKHEAAAAAVAPGRHPGPPDLAAEQRSW